MAVLDLVSEILVLHLVQVEDRQNLSVVGHKSLSNRVRASYESLKNLKGDSNDFRVSGIEGSLDRNNKLRNNGQNLSSSLFKHVENALNGQESVRVSLLSNTLEKDGQVMMVIELLDVYLPSDLVLGSVLN